MDTAEHAPAAEAKTCDHAGHGRHHHHAGVEAAVRDPVCGMSVDPATSRHRFDHNSETFHFCSTGCRTKFAADPAKYLDKQKPQAEAHGTAVPEGATYTCPMHPEVRQIGPGTCPICGMALEP
jgi:Cu+-exporting ATPase